MIHVAAFSGGKDSTALLLWLREQGIPFTAVFCDTGWEHPLTYAYVEEINQTLLGGRLITLRSPQYDMRSLVKSKGSVPMGRARFCTVELKIKPNHTWIEAQHDDVTMYQGVRAQESKSRAIMGQSEFIEDAGGYWIERPLFTWSAAKVFDYIHAHGLTENPLYRLGASRVGCYPCIPFVNHGDLKRATETMPEIWDRIAELEGLAGRSFFAPDFIPRRFHTGHDPKSGKSYPTIEDVKRYVIRTPAPFLELLDGEPRSCVSVYNLCE